MRPWRIALGALFVQWLVAALTSPISDSFQVLIIWLWAAVILGAETRWGEVRQTAPG
jgi:hypothetical protein